MNNVDWVHGEEGPTCTCGKPTFVSVLDGGQINLLCLLHEKEEGAFYPLPKDRPSNWPNLTHPEMAELVRRGFEEQGRDDD
jgi:hypothetical protein